MTIPRAKSSLGTSGWSAGLGRRGLSYILPFAVVAGLWQIASLFFPQFLFPSLTSILGSYDYQWRRDGVRMGRINVSLVQAF